MTKRETVDVDVVPISYLTAGKGGPLLLLLHGMSIGLQICPLIGVQFWV
jgi:hypothetical protein